MLNLPEIIKVFQGTNFFSFISAQKNFIFNVTTITTILWLSRLCPGPAD